MQTNILAYYNRIYNKDKNEINYYLKQGRVSTDGAFCEIGSLIKIMVQISQRHPTPMITHVSCPYPISH